MAFPREKLGLLVELYLGPDLGWVDITGDVRTDAAHSGGGITISRGRRAEASRTDPGSCALVVNNRHGKFSPRNPRSPYYGLLGRNTPIRVSLPTLPAERYLLLAGPQVTTPYVSALDVAGDIDLRVDIEPATSYDATARTGLASRWVATGTQRSWAWTLESERMRLYWSPDGTAASQRTILSPTLTIIPGERVALRVTLDVNNGAGVTATWYTAPTLAGPWTSLGTTTASGTSSIGTGSAPLEVADARHVAAAEMVGRLYGFEMRNGIGGTVVAQPDFAQAPGTTAWTDAAGLGWTVTAGRFVDRRYRFAGEVAAWPVRWDLSGRDRWVPIEAAGIMRRLGRGVAALTSPIRRHITSLAPLTYLPLEDESNTKVPTDAGTRPVGVGQQALEFGSGPALAGAARTARLAVGSWASAAVAMNPTTGWSVVWFVSMPSMPATDTRLVSIQTVAGPVARFDVLVDVDSISIKGYNTSSPTEVFTFTSGFGTGASPADGWMAMCLTATAAGSLTDLELKWFNVIPGDDGEFTYNYLEGSPTNILGPVTRVQIEPAGVAETAFGHLAVFDEPIEFSDAFAAAAHGHIGEAAGERMLRLSAETGVPVAVIGDPTQTTLMGPQLPATLLDLIQEAAESDMGLLYESRETVGLEYRTRLSLLGQRPLAVPYGRLVTPVESTDDDQGIANRVTAERVGGSSYELSRTSGPLSTQPPPDGVGLYDSSARVSVADDAQLVDQAGWRVHLGTVDEARWPRIPINLASPSWAADQAGTAAAASLESGDMLRLTDLPDWMPSCDVLALVQGMTEQLDARRWHITWAAAPGCPWYTASAADLTKPPTDTEQRHGAIGSTLAADITSTATSLSIATVAPNLWTANPTDFPLLIEVAGELIEIGAAGAVMNPTPFTVTTSNYSTQNGSLALSADYSYHPSYDVMKMTPSGAGEAQLRTAVVPATVGTSYTAGAWVYSPAGWATGMRASIAWETSGGSLVTHAHGTTVAVTAGRWTYLQVSGTAPATTAQARPRVASLGTPSGSDVYYVAALTIVPTAGTTTSPQAMTVTRRSVNGVIKSQSAGAAVDVAYPAIAS